MQLGEQEIGEWKSEGMRDERMIPVEIMNCLRCLTVF